MQRTNEAPMDFEFTDRPKTTPAWITTTPSKRPHDELNPSTPTNTKIFGENKGHPFLFQSPPPASPNPHPWAPPPDFSPEKAFPQFEVKDVDMREASPPKPTQDDGDRKFATGAMRRVLRSRMQAKSSKSKALVPVAADGDDATSEEDSSDEAEPQRQLQRAGSTSNHYTLNMAAPAPPPSDMPYILLGYLQFFFNLSLVILFLYLVVQFIWTVQRDVQERISEYSMDIIQDIALCRRQYENNLCSTPLPAMAAQCAQWALCMARDPAVVGRARVGAELIAEVVNGFVEPISWKTLGFTLTSLAFLTLFINTLLSLYRERARPKAGGGGSNGRTTPTTMAHPVHLMPPVTPYHHPAQGGYLSPAPTPSWADRRHWEQEEEMGTPTRARRRRVEGGAALKVR
uniref:Nuclear membrane protein n=1 Tax=Mycena chlorophos TaxID=658473 RepID=A0ABQ0LGX5_MYCCL|nr:nuclear membrane protein [Mycena chlorophos]